MLHAGAAECSDLKCQSCGQHYAWSLQRNCIIRCDTVNQVQFVFQQLLMALGDELVIFGSQYWGKKETEPVRKISAWAMRTGFFIALMLFILASLFPTQLLGLFTTDQTIIKAGLSYLAIIRFTYLFFAVTQILLATLRCVEIAGVAFGLSIMT